jgi:hypothetical protein
MAWRPGRAADGALVFADPHVIDEFDDSRKFHRGRDPTRP